MLAPHTWVSIDLHPQESCHGLAYLQHGVSAAWRICSMAFVAALTCANLSAGVITLDLRDPAGSAGEAFEAGNSFTVSGVTFSVAASTSWGTATGSYSGNSSTAGVNSDGVGDEPSRLDVGETLTFTLTFDDAALMVELENIDFSLVGGTADQAALVTTTAGSFTLFTGAADFNGTTNVWSPAGITFSTGDAMVIQASGSDNVVALQAMSFDVASIAVPEPAAFVVLFCLTACVAGFRCRRRRKI